MPPSEPHDRKADYLVTVAVTCTLLSIGLNYIISTVIRPYIQTQALSLASTAGQGVSEIFHSLALIACRGVVAWAWISLYRVMSGEKRVNGLLLVVVSGLVGGGFAYWDGVLSRRGN